MRALADQVSLIGFKASVVTEPHMRVLFVTNMWPDRARPYWGTFIQSQARSLERAGIAVDVLVIRGYRSTTAYLRAVPEIRRQVRRMKYDVTHIHTGHAAAVSVWWPRGPVVLSFVGGDVIGNRHEHGIDRRSRVEAAIFRQLGRRAAATITKTKEMEDSLPPAVRRRNTVIPNGVDLDAFAPMPRADARRALGWDAGEKVALFLGDPADPRKNVALARASVERGRRLVPNLRLHEAFGTPPEQIPKLMSAADCLVFSSRSEGSPNVVKEAMAAALPIVATPVGDVPERLRGIDGCFLVAPDSSAFANAVARAVQEPRALAAREAVKPLSLGAVAERVARVYEEAISSSPCPQLRCAVQPAST